MCQCGDSLTQSRLKNIGGAIRGNAFKDQAPHYVRLTWFRVFEYSRKRSYSWGFDIGICGTVTRKLILRVNSREVRYRRGREMVKNKLPVPRGTS